MPVTGSALVRRWAPTHRKIPMVPGWPGLSIDVSNYQGHLDDGFFERWTAQGYGGLIVQAVTGNNGLSYTAQQLQAALDHRWQVAAYVWCSPGDAMRSLDFGRRLDLLERFVEPLHFLALDVEELGLQPEDVDADLMRCDALKGDAPLYTGKYVFDRAGWSNQTYWADRRLWDSNYDDVPDVDANFVPYGGWHEAWLKQFTDGSGPGGGDIDQNVCRQS